MVSLRFGGQNYSDYDVLSRALPVEAVRTPTRSSVPLLDYRRDTEKRLREIGDAIDIDLRNAPELAFEHATPVPQGQGRGKASFTDLMIITPDAAVAIEAKFKEPPYEDVRTWLRTPPEENRKQVLNGWIRLIGTATRSAIAPENLLDLPYQLIHRTASVCGVLRPSRAVVYQLFGDESPSYYVSALSNFRKALGAITDLKFAVIVTAASDANPERLTPTNPDDLRCALCEGPLFHFSPALVHRI